MKVVIIHGQSHKGSTYHIAHMLAVKISEDIKEFSLIENGFKEEEKRSNAAVITDEFL